MSASPALLCLGVRQGGGTQLLVPPRVQGLDALLLVVSPVAYRVQQQDRELARLGGVCHDEQE